MKFIPVALFSASVLLAQSASADVAVQFIEGAPKDQFVIEAKGACDLNAITVEIDLAPAKAGLIFDVSSAGAGVEVFQPFELITGAQQVINAPDVKDGDQTITLSLSGLSAPDKVAFSVDIDDTGGGREITVSGAEIAGAVVRVRSGAAVWEAAFTSDAKALVKTQACPA